GLRRRIWMAADVVGNSEGPDLDPHPGVGRLLADASARPFTDPLFITNLLRAPGGREALLWDRAQRLPPLRLEGLTFHDGQRVVRARFAGGSARLIPGRRYRLAVPGSGAVAVFDSTCVEQRGRAVLASLPTEVRQAGLRASPRAPVDGEWSFELAWEGRRLQGPLREVGAGGFSFPLEVASIRAGGRLRLGLRLPAGAIDVPVVVRSLGPPDARGVRTCGVELVGLRGDD